MKKFALLPVLAVALASCSMMGPVKTDYTLAKPAIIKPTGAVYAPAGKITVGQVTGVTRTTASLSGLAPYGIYVAHYHVMGKDSTNACDSNGAAIEGTKIVAQADKDGKLTMDSYMATPLLKDAAYFNVHTASDFNGTTADSGVICSAVTIAQ